MSSKPFVALLVILLAVLTNLKYKQFKGQQQVEKLKNQIRDQAAQQEQKNKDLIESIAYLNTESFKEQAARKQLNLKKEGELVYSFSETRGEIIQTSPVGADVSNPRKWWNYFFN